MKSTTKFTLFCSRRIQILLTVTAFLLVVRVMASAQTETVLYNFAGGADGWVPQGGLVADTQGNLYGTTFYGGVDCSSGLGLGCGTVFVLSPTGVKTILHNFAGAPADGFNPDAALVRDLRGNLYGTTKLGGAFDAGTVFRVTPTGKEKVLYNFTGGTDGKFPDGSLLYVRGYLYGVTGAGGSGTCPQGCGTVFQLAPDGTETVLYNFTGGADGGTPRGGLIRDSQGNFYGVTALEGTFDAGTLFKLTPTGTLTVVCNLLTSANGGLVNLRGNFYGTTHYGGKFNAGSVFKVSRAGTETVRHSFYWKLTDGNGNLPLAGLVADSEGNLYGTTSSGGASYAGVVFRIASDGTETVLYTFTGGADGGSPQNGSLILDAQGNLYGTAGGGSGGAGIVFKVTP